MNSRAYQFQLQAAEAAAAAAPIVHAAERGGPEVVTPKAPLLLKIQAAAQDTAADEPAPRQGNGLAPTTTGTIGNAAEATKCKCPECPKWFASEKAMFGHLRKHPERGYKGATRPTTATASAAAAAAAAVAGDKKPTKKVPRKETGVPAAMNMAAAAATKAWAEADLSTKWPASVKRGRTPVVPVQQASGCSEEEEAAMTLLELASFSRTSSETQQQSVEPVRAPDATVTSHQIQAAVVEDPMLLDHPVAHQTPEAEQQIVHTENALEVSAESQTPAVNKQVTDTVITTEAVLIVVPANKPIFPSLDSAGTGDKKAKKQRRVTNPPEQTAAASTSPPLPPPKGAVIVRTPPARRIPSPASDKKHTCPTCGKSFPTHQALGGHMYYHVKGAKTTSARHDDLAAAQAMQNILAHREEQSSGSGTGAGTRTRNRNGNGNGNVNIPASAGVGAGVADALQERQEAQPPPAQGKALMPTPKLQAAAPYVGPGAGADAFQVRLEAQPPPAKAKAPAPTPTSTPQAAAPHLGAGAGASQECQEAQPPPSQAQAKAAAPHVCDACHLIFPSGQALGGHKRKHWFQEKQQAKAASAQAPAPAPRDFDLNEMPQEGQGENNDQP